MSKFIILTEVDKINGMPRGPILVNLDEIEQVSIEEMGGCFIHFKGSRFTNVKESFYDLCVISNAGPEEWTAKQDLPESAIVEFTPYVDVSESEPPALDRITEAEAEKQHLSRQYLKEQ